MDLEVPLDRHLIAAKALNALRGASELRPTPIRLRLAVGVVMCVHVGLVPHNIWAEATRDPTRVPHPENRP